MKPLIPSAILIAIVICYFSFTIKQQDISSITQFESWKIKFNKKYQSESEEIYRLTTFIDNLKQIEIHNAQLDKTYEVGVNQFTDLTKQQFVETYLTFKPSHSLRIQPKLQVIKSQESNDDQVDWVKKGFVTSVKNQGACGSCWAFSALGPLEALLKMQGNPLVSLSAQQLMDCSTDYGNYGCNGGFMDGAYKYIKDKGITTEDNYPYKGQYQKCLKKDGQFKIKGYVDLQDCSTIASQLKSIPIAAAVDATSFYNYKSGVITCPTKANLNHGFALVGMTSEYWLAKDSWGTSWGQNGYIRIARTGTQCGICQMASYPV